MGLNYSYLPQELCNNNSKNQISRVHISKKQYKITYIIVIFSFFIVAEIDSSEVVPSQPFPMALPPPSCHLPNSSLLKGIYNRGYCPDTPCHTLFGICSKTSHNCCLRDWLVNTLSLICSENLLHTNVSIVLLCRCQECSKVHTVFSGYVYSSLDQKPLPLAGVVLKYEVVTCTDSKDHFVFEMSVPSDTTSLEIMILEPNH